MNELENIMKNTREVDDGFRLFITSGFSDVFPIGLLQMSIKVTNEPPKGLKSGISRTFSTIVNQDFIDKIDSSQWRVIVFTICFMHSIVQERRKFGPIGFCIPYEFNNSDLQASMFFIEKHISLVQSLNQPISWKTVQYMVSEIQYGGRITDNLDRELFNTYSNEWISDKIFLPGFTFGKADN
jgi:dynein heavy chain